MRERSPVGGWPIAAAIAVIGLLLYAVRYAILPFVFAAAIGFVTDPLIEAARRRTGWRRGIVAALAYVVLLAVFALVAYTIGSNAVRELTQLVERAPSIARNIIGYIVGDRGVVLFGTAYDTDTVMRELAAAVKGLIGTGLAAQVGLSLIGFAAGLAMTLVLTPFFMISGPRLAAGTIWLIPPERRRSVMVLLPRIVPVLQRYLIGIVVVVAYTASVAWLGFGLVARLPNAALLALSVGLLEIIPVAGPVAAATLVGMAAVQQTSLAGALSLIAFVIALRLSIDNLVGPLVLGQATRLHPVVIMAGFLCGAMLFGVVGLLLAVPTAVCIKIALEHYYAEPIRPQEQ